MVSLDALSLKSISLWQEIAMVSYLSLYTFFKVLLRCWSAHRFILQK
ncbi:hypothetical protein Q655_00528 [Bartonella henselae JK 51]|uniref:Uncharacterized protein n=1 Tax=Bartonella henselae TaxID=38323 RepID=X5M316_BARHN|nr:hypothetical protein Q654_00580 [Bartonella henselae JK 50]ETS09343.1 hypothetical protein Q655_00528 [Bartonella henselae JK 51]ETS09767.1 hypothetical protein Q653_00844 [Bartonella henselae JK 42]ETS12795.1 hypothetical protein Q652_00974 [Bartonella henselae JK 41]KEC58550.1 hypothetical protein O97_00448 [Bartonella henselae str. Zeus]KEC61063.1 hypothetical protein O95_00014 [Bartonella henselae JK 53]CDO46176.1 hypothetical protein BM1374165_00151 [Bartonella henselae]